MQKGFVYLDSVVPNLKWDAKYFGTDNFTGSKVDGYLVNRVVGSVELANQLKVAQALANQKGLELFIFDAYRPQQAVDFFLEWAKLPEDFKTKQKHYPKLEKSEMFNLGYVAKKSGHTRGGTLDLTLKNLETNEFLEMGTEFDYMDLKSHHGALGLKENESANRETLKEIMLSSKFKPFEQEWWHYTLIDEPFPDSYFDFPIE